MCWIDPTSDSESRYVIHKKVAITPFSDELESVLILSTKKVLKWIVTTIETIEKERWVNICSKLENLILLELRNRNEEWTFL